MSNLMLRVGGVAKTRRVLCNRGEYNFYCEKQQMYLSKGNVDAIDLKHLEAEYLQYDRECIYSRFFYLTVLVVLALIYSFAIILHEVVTGRFSISLFTVLMVLSALVVAASFLMDNYRRSGI